MTNQYCGKSMLIEKNITEVLVVKNKQKGVP